MPKFTAIPLYDQIPLGGATHLIEVTAEDLTETTADTPQTIAVALPAGTLAGVSAIKTVELFEDTEDAAFNNVAVTIGDAGSATRYLSSTQVNANAGTPIRYKGGAELAHAYNVAGELRIAFASMAAKSLADLNKGRLLVYARLTDLKEYGPYT